MTGADERAPAIEVRDLHFSYKNTYALRGLTFTVQERSIHGFVGPNGAGKTTTLKVLATLLRPKMGDVRVCGYNVRTHPVQVRRRIGFMPDHFALYQQMTVFECLDFFAAAYGLSAPERDRVIGDVLALTDMDKRRDDVVKTLSRGMVQRVSLARVLVNDPQALLLDEPAAGLDPRARIELMEILRELRRLGKTIFISSHILSELADLCDSVTIIDAGVVRHSGPMDGLLALQGKDARYVLALRQEHPPVEGALRALDGVTGVVKEPDQPVYRIVFDPERTDTNTVVRAVLDSGGELAWFRQEARELSAVFMELTQPGVPS